MRLAVPLLLFVLAGCTSPPMPVVPPPPVTMAPITLYEPCGVHDLLDRRRSGDASVSGRFYGVPVRACALPDAGAIAHSCGMKDAPPLTGSTPADDGPRYRVDLATCRYLDDRRTRAECSFDLATPGTPASRITRSFTNRISDLSDEIAHDYFVWGWEAATRCHSAG